jgi:hypothetical protein
MRIKRMAVSFERFFKGSRQVLCCDYVLCAPLDLLVSKLSCECTSHIHNTYVMTEEDFSQAILDMPYGGGGGEAPPPPPPPYGIAYGRKKGR